MPTNSFYNNKPDSALDDFLSRFGDKDPNKKKVQNLPQAYTEGKGVENIPQRVDFAGLLAGKESKTETVDATIPKGVDALGGALSVLPEAMGLLSMGKGDTFDTDAESGGPGSKGFAALAGGAMGLQAGMKFGAIGGAVGGAVGVSAGLIRQAGAVKDYKRNQKKHNLNLNAIEKAENEEAYAMREGEESRGLLKSLRQKQLGIINT